MLALSFNDLKHQQEMCDLPELNLRRTCPISDCSCEEFTEPE